MFNILAGEMALVGPRPHPLEAKAGNMLYAQAVPGYHRRHRVLPGITGWAQVNGWRGETVAAYQIEQRVHYDLEYISCQSLWFDLQIFALTIVCVIRHKDKAW
jgi:lipopolysaccharide/colanic/teichoic acid biosynthesis glycosyltransferase